MLFSERNCVQKTYQRPKNGTDSSGLTIFLKLGHYCLFKLASFSYFVAFSGILTSTPGVV